MTPCIIYLYIYILYENQVLNKVQNLRTNTKNALYFLIYETYAVSSKVALCKIITLNFRTW